MEPTYGGGSRGSSMGLGNTGMNDVSLVDDTDMMDDMDARDDTGMDAGDTDAVIQAQKAEVEQTRAEIGSTIDAIKEKLEPATLVQQAKDSVREATIGRAQEAMESVTDTARYVMSNAGDTAQQAGSNVMAIIRENPIPAAMIGIGLGWLIMSARKHNGNGHTYDAARSYDYSPTYGTGYGDREYTDSGYGTVRSEYDRPSMGDRMGEMGDRIGDKVEDLKERVSETTSRMGDRVHDLKDRVQGKAGELKDRVQYKAGELKDRTQETVSSVGSRAGYQASMLKLEAKQKADQAGEMFQRTLQDNPMALGLAAVGLGIAVGMALPETTREHQLMGETKERVMDRAQEMGQNVAQKVQGVATQAINTVKEEVQGQGGLMEQAKDAVRQGVQAANQEAQAQGLMPESGSTTGSSSGSGTAI